MQEPPLERNFGFLGHDVARLLRVAYDRRAKALGLTRSQWWVLNNLFRRDGITQSELADLLEIEKATLGRLIDRLEAKGWVERRSDPRDRRANRLHLTGEVQALMQDLRRIAAGLRADALKGMAPEEAERLIDALALVKANLGRLNGQPPPDRGGGNDG
jgi:DNA-binding MarR family transcriptional regulator